MKKIMIFLILTFLLSGTETFAIDFSTSIDYVPTAPMDKLIVYVFLGAYLVPMVIAFLYFLGRKIITGKPMYK